jgi:hypothetical protein
MSWNIFSKMRKVKCPGNRVVLVYRNPRAAFPLYAEDWKAQVKVAADAATELSGEVGGEFAKHMSGLLIKLNETNGSMQLKLSAIYQHYSEDPCTRENWFQRRLEQTLDEETLLNRAKFELEALRVLADKGANQNELINHVEQMMERLTLSDDELSRRMAFDNASKAVDAWQK